MPKFVARFCFVIYLGIAAFGELKESFHTRRLLLIITCVRFQLRFVKVRANLAIETKLESVFDSLKKSAIYHQRITVHCQNWGKTL